MIKFVLQYSERVKAYSKGAANPSSLADLDTWSISGGRCKAASEYGPPSTDLNPLVNFFASIVAKAFLTT